MKQFSYVIKDEIGLHARPAGLLAKEAKKYPYTMLTRSPGLYTMKRMACITAMNLVINRLTVLPENSLL